MINSQNYLDPMHQSVYLERDYPATKEDVVKYMEAYTLPPKGAKLKSQPTKDTWCYSKDNANGRKISFGEKLKAFFTKRNI